MAEKTPLERTNETAIKVGDLVTGVEGRDSHGWHGTVKAIETFNGDQLYYRVHWRERETLGCQGGATIGMLANQIKKKL